MTYAGAEKNTETTMAETMHFTLPDQKLHTTINQQSILLNFRGEGAQGADGEPFRMRVVNSIWGREGYRIVDSFLDTIAINYGAGLRLLDFTKAPDESRIVINTWVEDQTEDRIKDLLPPGSINSSLVMVLVNAVYFNAGWTSKFMKESTAEGDFTDLSGATVTAQMMNQIDGFAHYKGDGYQAVELLYDGNQMSMVLLVPDAERFAQFEQGLTVDTLSQVTSSLELTSVQLSMPKWKFETDTIAMKKLFEALGMGIAFTDAADFSGMVEGGGIFIDNIYHKAFVAVDESGTEAAAATAVVMINSSTPMANVVLVIDRPFIYYIRDIETDTIVFMGRVADPS